MMGASAAGIAGRVLWAAIGAAVTAIIRGVSAKVVKKALIDMGGSDYEALGLYARCAKKVREATTGLSPLGKHLRYTLGSFTYF
jgi:hypothetical protein